jgi:hypothetical protein
LGALQTEIKTLPLNVKEKKEVMAQAADLGNAKVPASVGFNEKAAVESSYHSGFIYAYKNILQISAALGFLGALMSFLFIKDSVVKKA